MTQTPPDRLSNNPKSPPPRPPNVLFFPPERPSLLQCTPRLQGPAQSGWQGNKKQTRGKDHQKHSLPVLAMQHSSTAQPPWRHQSGIEVAPETSPPLAAQDEKVYSHSALRPPMA